MFYSIEFMERYLVLIMQENRLTFSCKTLKNSQTNFINLALFTPQKFESMFNHFSTLCLKGLKQIYTLIILTLSWRRSLLYRNQSIDYLDLFLFNRDRRHERINKIALLNLSGSNSRNLVPHVSSSEKDKITMMINMIKSKQP